MLAIAVAHAQQGRDHKQHTDADTRVGINTDKPVATLEVKRVDDVPTTQVQGFLLPHLTKAERDAMEKGALVNGLMIFNTTKNCIDWWDGTNWQCTDGSLKDGPIPEPTPIELPDIEIGNSKKWFSSIKDDNYLPFRASDVPATASWNNLAPVNPDATTEPKALDVQGIITTEPIEVFIPINITRVGELPAFKSYLEIPAEQTEDGKGGMVELYWENLSLRNTGKSYFQAYIKASNNPIHLKKLDVAKGLGQDHMGLHLGKFSYPKNRTESKQPSSTWTGEYELRLISGIPDRNFEKETEGQYRHQLMYIPVMGPDGQIWLNNNLGADYANINKNVFNPAQQAKAATDHLAYGSLFQWGREANGHELINWTSGTEGKPVFEQEPYNWTSENSNNLRQFNENCPAGWHTPIRKDFFDITAIANTKTINVDDKHHKLGGIRLPFAGSRYSYNGSTVNFSGTLSYIWSSEPYSTNSNSAYYFFSNPSTTYIQSHTNAFGYGIRCLKD